MKPIAVVEPSVIIPAHVAVELYGAANEGLRSLRLQGLFASEDTREAIEKLRIVAEAWALRAEPTERSRVPEVEIPHTAPIEWVSVETAARILLTSDRNVRALCDRGSLHATKGSGRSWHICKDSLAARKERQACQH